MTFRFKRESGGPMPKPKIIDTADTMTSSKLSALKKAGVETIIRYDDRRPRGGWKQIHPAEAKLIRDAGLRLGIVYEDAATASYFTRLEGILSATYARQQAAKRGQPEGAPSISRSTSIRLQQMYVIGSFHTSTACIRRLTSRTVFRDCTSALIAAAYARRCSRRSIRIS